MHWWERLFEPSTWFYWTAAGRGARDGVQGYPSDDACVAVELPQARIDAVSNVLGKILRTCGEDARGSASAPTFDASGGAATSGGGRRSAIRDGDADDYGHVPAAVRRLLELQGVNTSNLDDELLCKIGDVLADCASADRTSAQMPHSPQHTPPSSTQEPAAPTSPSDAAPLGSAHTAVSARRAVPAEISLPENTWLRIAEGDIDKLMEKWKQAKQLAEGKAKQARHYLVELFEETKMLHERHRQKDLRQPHRVVPLPLYLFIMCLLGIFELPVNVVAFRILRESQVLTMAMAVGATFAVIILAHFVGMILRQWPSGQTRWPLILLANFVFIALVVGLLSMGYLRASYIAYSEKAARNWGDVAVLLGVNMLALAAGTAASFYLHDPDVELESLIKQKRQVRRRMNRIWKDWTKQAARLDELQGRLRHRIEYVRDDALARMSEYRDYNMKFRHLANRSEPTPRCFGDSTTNRLFRPRSLSGEIDRPPASVDELLKHAIEGERADVAFQKAAATRAPEISSREA
jgi:hypothetical protein